MKILQLHAINILNSLEEKNFNIFFNRSHSTFFLFSPVRNNNNNKRLHITFSYSSDHFTYYHLSYNFAITIITL